MVSGAGSNGMAGHYHAKENKQAAGGSIQLVQEYRAKRLIL
jgi:hypothetical protein